jgi:hypothetical protein
MDVTEAIADINADLGNIRAPRPVAMAAKRTIDLSARRKTPDNRRYQKPRNFGDHSENDV